MNKIEPGKYVEMLYKLSVRQPDSDEEMIYESDPKQPERLVFGVTRGLLPALEKALPGLEEGGTFDITATPDEAFGPYDPEQVATLDRDVFLIDGKFDEEHIVPGVEVPMMTADGYRIDGKVLEVTPTHVKVDFNHPLAGKDVRFVGTVTTVRDATPEELHPAEGCGCGCSGGCSSDDSSCGCDHSGCADGGCCK